EDGIRDDLVTGVQTCALPIWKPGGELGIEVSPLVATSSCPPCPRPTPARRGRSRSAGIGDTRRRSGCSPAHSVPRGRSFCPDPRSEERRVGKECVWWWAAGAW